MTASPASSTLRRQRFLDVLMINHQANVALFGTSQSMLHQSWANLPRRMWSFFLSLPHFPRQISIFVSPSTKQRSYTTAVSACNQKAKEKRKPPCAWRIVLYLRITFDKAKVLHDCSFCMQPKGKGKTKTTLCVTNRALSGTAAQNVAFCVFFSCV